MKEKSQFCPDYCTFLSEDFQAKRRAGEAYDICNIDCWHKDDKTLVEPFRVDVERAGTVRTELAVGESIKFYYTVDNNGALGKVGKDQIKPR